eukprot:CAMPEP_0194510850 /NCGR_PEP_ID=MMETSP0253-20130528/42314_1 /TAXON_ID=2966 /ORGANISM="Noctiluca scintillans" /LENGTH=192 /DNA_ID=CAMNT_0039354131 /DNA_START=45 /DNA_END=623 /DNA_ORIENTATION=-
MTDRTSFPAWEPWMGQFVSQDDYSKLVNVCIVEASKKPTFNAAGCAKTWTFLCPCLCICTGPYLYYLKQQVDAATKLAKENVAATGVEGATFDVINFGASRSGWFDHRGTELLMSSRQGMRPGGPPVGYNLIFTTKAPLAWPPQQVAAAPVQGSMVAPATVGNTAAANFCASCGKQREGNGKFCTGCGAAFG